jgi:hypothetical protein
MKAAYEYHTGKQGPWIPRQMVMDALEESLSQARLKIKAPREINSGQS